MNLTKEQILAFYLHHKLKFMVENDLSEDFSEDVVEINPDLFKKGAIWELAAINTSPELSIPVGYSLDGELCRYVFKNESTWITINSGLTPMFRSLDSLATEQEINGEMVVPIVEFAKMMGFKDLKRFEVDDYVGYGWNERGLEDSQDYEFSFDEVAMLFGVYYDSKIENPRPIYHVGTFNNTLEAIKMGFNVFNLPKGEYIDLKI